MLFVILAVALAGLCADAGAFDELIPTHVVRVRFAGKPARGRSFLLVSKAEPPLSFQLPRVTPAWTGGGLTVRVGTGSLICNLPARTFDGTEGWKALGRNPSGCKGYIYVNRNAPGGLGGPCRVVAVTGKMLRVITKGTGGLPTPADDPPGNPAVTMALALGGDNYCAEALAPHVQEKADKLIKAKGQGAPSSCPIVSTTVMTTSSTTSTTGASTSTTTLPPDRLAVYHSNDYPTRLAEGPLGHLYVSDAKVGSAFIYDATLDLIGELKGVDRPLGVAVDGQGNMYVGSDGSDGVEVYSPTGVPLFVIDEGDIRKPNDLAIDRQGRVYVADSLSDTVKVYDGAGTWRRNIGWPGDDDGGLRFPVAVAIAYRTGAGGQEVGELYVADQGHARVQVFDLEGRFLRTYGSAVPAFSSDWEGRFVNVQSLAVDAQGRLHVLDSYLNRVQILHAETGAYLDSYGAFGTEVGQLNVPLDICITRDGKVVVANAENHRVEPIDTVP